VPGYWSNFRGVFDALRVEVLARQQPDRVILRTGCFPAETVFAACQENR
jgi:hypothetical protein